MISHIAPYRPLYGFRHLLTKRHPFCIYAAYNDLLCCLTIFKTVYHSYKKILCGTSMNHC